MRRTSFTFLIFSFTLWLSLTTMPSPALSTIPISPEWQELMPGLFYGTFEHKKEDAPSQRIHALRIDPNLYDFSLHSAMWEEEALPIYMSSWQSQKKLIAAINASMYKEDNITSVGYMRQGEHINNSHIGTQLDAFFVAQPKDDALPPACIIYRGDENWEEKIENYELILQNYRLFENEEKEDEAWQSKRTHSISALATDKEGYVLFLHSQKPITIQDFIHILKNYPLIDRAAYLEGGGQASMVVQSPLFSKLFLGQSTQLLPPMQLPLPNIIGIRKK